MKNSKKMISAAVVGLVMVAGTALALPKVDQNITQNVDQALLNMQQQMIEKNYSSMLLKDQMRGKMMAERTPQNYMQDGIQPVMMEKMRDQIKPQQMQLMTKR